MHPVAARVSCDDRRGAIPELLDGVVLRPLAAHSDARGLIAEYFRVEWCAGIEPQQWMMAVSRPGVMRGVHVHPLHDDYFVLIAGRVVVGLRDLRPGSPSEHRTAMFELRGETPAALVVPHGVAHGFLFRTESSFVLGASRYYDPADELGCHWRDPALAIPWPVDEAILSERDAALPTLAALAGAIRPWMP